MQASHKILVVIRPMIIKQTKKTVSCECEVFYNITHIDWHYVTSVCFTANTQITNFSFQIIVGRKSLFFYFFGLYIHFFREWMGTHLFGRALPRSHKLFFWCPWITFLDAFLKKRMAPPTWNSERSAKCWIEICNWVVLN